MVLGQRLESQYSITPDYLTPTPSTPVPLRAPKHWSAFKCMVYS